MISPGEAFVIIRDHLRERGPIEPPSHVERVLRALLALQHRTVQTLEQEGSFGAARLLGEGVEFSAKVLDSQVDGLVGRFCSALQWTINHPATIAHTILSISGAVLFHPATGWVSAAAITGFHAKCLPPQFIPKEGMLDSSYEPQFCYKQMSLCMENPAYPQLAMKSLSLAAIGAILYSFKTLSKEPKRTFPSSIPPELQKEILALLQRLDSTRAA